MVGKLVELLDELYGFQILISAIPIWDPFTRTTRIIQIEERGHRIHSQAIQMIFAKPEKGVGQEKVADFVAAVVEDEGSPIPVLTAPRVSVFIEIGTIKIAQPMSILWKVCR